MYIADHVNSGLSVLSMHFYQVTKNKQFFYRKKNFKFKEINNGGMIFRIYLHALNNYFMLKVSPSQHNYETYNFYTVSIIFSPKKKQLQNNKYIYMYKNLG